MAAFLRARTGGRPDTLGTLASEALNDANELL